MRMNRQRALIGFTLMMSLLIGLGLISLPDLPGWRAQAENGSAGGQADQTAATGAVARKPLGASATGLSPAGYAAPAAAPEMSVEQPYGTVIADGGSKNFGTQVVGANNTLTFTIRNTGTAALNLTGNPRVVIGGANAADFTVTAQPVTPVPVNNVIIQNAGFETSGGWTFGGTQFGLAWITSFTAGSDLHTQPLEGNYVASFRNEGYMSQTLNFPATGDYVIRFYVLRKIYGATGADDITVKMDGTTLGIAPGASQDTVEWREFSVPYSCTTIGNHTLTFVGQEFGSRGSFVDKVDIAPVAGLFQVAFSPKAGGPRTASLSIANNDSDENPYNITLTGAGIVRPEISIEQPASTPLVTGNVAAWGFDWYDQTRVPSGLNGVKAIAAGENCSVALKGDGTIVAWGARIQDAPAGLTNVIAVDAGNAHFLALKSDGTVVAWGDNSNFQTDVPAGLTGVVAIAAGASTSVALKSNGTVVEWGFHLPGNGVPSGLTNVTAIAKGTAHTVALKSDGTVVAWGATTNNGEANVPQGLTGVVGIAAGGYDSYAIKSDGTVVGWGSQGWPVPSGLTGVVAVAAADWHALALKNDGTVTAWGSNARGQLNVPSGLRGVRAVAAGGSQVDLNFPRGHSLALTDSTVDFGTQAVGFTIAKTFTIKNTGSAPLTISGVSVTGGQASNFPVNTAGMLTTVPINGQTTFSVTFTPNSVGAKQATLRVLNNDSDEGSFYVNLAGNGVTPTPDIAVFNGASTAPADERTNNTGTFTFPNTTLGNTSAAQTFTIKNVGTANLTGIAITLAGTNTSDFVLNASGATSLAPNATRTFTVSFKPTADGMRNAIVRIASNDPDENPFLINISGTGVNNPPTITASTFNLRKGGSINRQIATVADQQDAWQTLVVTVNGAASATVNGVTVRNLTNSSGLVRADVTADCNATNASFTLTVRDSAGATASATLTVTVSDNVSPSAGTYPNTVVAAGGSTTVTPSTSPSDSGGSIASITATTTPNTFTGTIAMIFLSGELAINNANPPGNYTVTVNVTDNCGASANTTFNLTVSGGVSTGLAFYPLPSPLRLLDTRAGFTGCDAPGAPITGGTSRTQLARRTCNGVTIPANAMAVTGNVTTVQSAGGFLTLYPSGVTQPLTASTNFKPNEILNNVFTVGVGDADGSFKIFASSDTDVVVDITGYYAPPAAAGLYFHPLPKPIRLLETRQGFTGCQVTGTPLQTGSTRLQTGVLTCDGVTIPAGAQALVGNATTTNSAGSGYLTLFPADAAQPNASSSNFAAGINRNAPFTVGLSLNGEFSIYTAQTTDLVIDVLGYYSTAAMDGNGAGLLFTPLSSPVRLLETRAGQPGCYTTNAPLAAGSIRNQQARGVCGGQTIADTAAAIVGNATVINNQVGYLTFWSDGAVQPAVATTNFAAGQILNRHFTTRLSTNGIFNIFASAQTDLILDVSGYFAP